MAAKSRLAGENFVVESVDGREAVGEEVNGAV